MKWLDNRDIDIVEIDGELYALHGWNGEKWHSCWKCIDKWTAAEDGQEYEIRPVYAEAEEDLWEIVGYELV